MKAAILGAGVIGAGWAARFLTHGWDVAVFDHDAAAGVRVTQVAEIACARLTELYDVELPKPGCLTICGSAAEAVREVDWVQESAPEQSAIKRDLFASLVGLLDERVPVASSTSGFKPSQLSDGCVIAGQMLVCHPFNPVYLLPGVEVVASGSTTDAVRDTAMTHLASIGMQPVLVRAEIDAHIADRLLEAVWREALWLVRDGVATTGEIDAIMRSSFGLRWAQMGLFETYRLGGGDGGFRHFLEQFGPALQWPWSRLTDVPELDEALIEKIVSQSDEQTGDRTTAQMAAQRDRNLVALMRALKDVDDAAGQGLNRFERDTLAGLK